MSDAQAILGLCHSGGALLARTQPIKGKLRKIWLLTYLGKRMALITTEAADFIVTFLPPDYFTAGQSRKRGTWRARSKRKYPGNINNWNLP